jgi:hypothetical protein
MKRLIQDDKDIFDFLMDLEQEKSFGNPTWDELDKAKPCIVAYDFDENDYSMSYAKSIDYQIFDIEDCTVLAQCLSKEKREEFIKAISE